MRQSVPVLVVVVLLLAACSPGVKGKDPATTGCQGPTCCQNDASCDATCGPGGCTCLAGTCQPKACSSDAECSGLICTSGDCAEPAPIARVASCAILPRHLLLRDGDRLQLAILTFDEAGSPVRTSEHALLSVSGAEVTVNDATLVGGSAAGQFTATATLGAATCSSQGVALGASSVALRVAVVDELTALPIEGAVVQVESPSGPVVAISGTDGSALFTTAPPAPRTVSVFAAGHGYLTVIAVNGNDLLMPVRREPPDSAHLGMKGAFGPQDLFGSEGLQVGLAGMSIPGSLLDLSLPVIAGPNLNVTIRIGVPAEVQIPSGLVFGLGRTWFKSSYQATVEPGLCADAARDGTGSCALRTAWGLAGSVPLNKIPIELFTGQPPDPGTLLAELLPSFAGFRSAVRRDVAMDAVPDSGGQADVGSFPEVDLDATEPLRLGSPLTVPELPAGDRPLRSVVALAGVREPGGGMVLLGMDAGLDQSPADGLVDGPIALRHAPAHDGLEGGNWVTMALALDLEADGSRCTRSDASRCMATSGLFRIAPSMPDGQAVTFDGPFLGLPLQAVWADGTRSLDSGAVGGQPTLLRVLLNGSNGTWAIFAPADTAVVVPGPPPGYADPAAGGPHVTVQAVRASVSLDALAAGGTASLADLLGVAQAFSSLELPH